MPQKHGPLAGVGVRVSPAALMSDQHDRTCATLRRSRLRVRAPRCSYTDHVAQRIGRQLAKLEVAGSIPAVVIAPPAVDGVVVDGTAGPVRKASKGRPALNGPGQRSGASS